MVIHGIDQGTRFEIGEGRVGLGRGVRNEIRILDTEVSRFHAVIDHAEGTFVLHDLNSSNGTFVNGVPVRSHKLHSGDQIQIGRSSILFTETVDEDESKLVSGKVDLFDRPESEDSSNIVGEVGQAAGQQLLEESRTIGAPEFAKTRANLQALYRVSEEAVRPSSSLDQLLQRILRVTIDVVGADRGCLLVTDPQTSELAPQVFSHRRDIDDQSKMPVSRSIVNYVQRNGQGVRTSDARSDHRFEPGQSILQAGIREAMCVPMQGRYELMGVIYVDTTTPPERVILDGGNVKQFSDEQLHLLVAIGRQAALAIEDNRYQQAFVKAERLAAVGQTIATLSHHIKNILQGIRGGSYLIDMGLKDHNEELITKGWNIVEKNQNKIYQLVMDMLTFSTERQPALERASLNDTVSDVCELMQVRAEEGNVKLECELANDLPETTFDPEGIHRAVLNIVTNAIDAVEGTSDPIVRVCTGYDQNTDEMSVEISDNGSGIPEEQLPAIFNLFESTKGARGTGIGLAVSQKILREHGGEISVESRPIQGSRFRLAWPRVDDDQQTAEETKGS